MKIFKKSRNQEMKGVIGQFKLIDWWNKHFDSIEQNSLIEASKNVRTLSIGGDNSENRLTELNCDGYTRLTPLIEFNLVFQGIKDDNFLQKKFVYAVDELIQYYLSNDFNMKKEYVRITTKETRTLFDDKIDDILKYHNHILDIDFFYSGVIAINYKMKSNKINKEICMDFCEKYNKISKTILEYKEIENNYFKEWAYKRDTELTEWRKLNLYNIHNLALDKYVMLLQFEKEYNKALEIIEKSKNDGWNIDWDNRVRILNKLKASK